MTPSVGLVICNNVFQNSGKYFHLPVYYEKFMIKDTDEHLDGGDAQGKVWGRGEELPYLYQVCHPPSAPRVHPPG